MSINHLSQNDISIIGECLKAAAFGPFFNKCQSIDEVVFGFNLNELIEVSSRWPQIAVNNDVNRIISNVLSSFMPEDNPLFLKPEAWDNWISTSPSYVIEILSKWRRLDFPLTEKEAFDIASKYAFKNELNRATSKVEKKVFTNSKINIVQHKSWGWVFRLDLASDYPSRVVIVNRFNGYHLSCPADKSESDIERYEKSLLKWDTNFGS